MPCALVAEWLTLYVPALTYWCEGFCWLLVYPSPKSQYQNAGEGKPALWSLKSTEVPGIPVTGLAVKEAVGRDQIVIFTGCALIMPSYPLDALRLTRYTPAVVYVCTGFCKVEALPSPKFQSQETG